MTTVVTPLGSRWLEIEDRARILQRDLWKRRTQLWDRDVPSSYVDVLEPSVGLELVGYRAEMADYLGNFGYGTKVSEVAGLLDRGQKLVQISRRFPREVQLFTAAHELGHVVLGHAGEIIHRDKPLQGSNYQRDWKEREADWFATCFLMPEQLVRQEFTEIFGIDRFELTDATAFALCRTSVQKIMQNCQRLRDLSRMLAETNSYDDKKTLSLNSLFSVSTTAMAIRLEQLGLVVPPDMQKKIPDFLYGTYDGRRG